ncbi:hypothetical protein JCM10212_003131 [Sporobolomyces blumeae]
MSSSSDFPRPPPDYAAASSSQAKNKPAPPAAYGATTDSDARKPLLQPGEGGAPRDAWAETGDLEDDFVIGVTLSQSSQDVRNDFVRKVYSVLFLQILFTSIVGWTMTNEKIAVWTFQHVGLVFPLFLLTLGSMFMVQWKYRSSPLNVIFLGVFTLCEAITIGWIMPAYNPETILKALVITTFVFLGLTLFTFQTKRDFTSWGPYLFMLLLGFVGVSFVGIFFPFGSTLELVTAGVGCLLFSAWIVFDTQMLLKHLHPDQWALACIKLYLDIINLFLQILRILSEIQDR